MFSSLVGGMLARRMAAALVLAFALAGLALASLASAAAQPPDVYAVDNSNNLLRFNSATPGTIESTVPITGLQTGERIFNIDFRPADGQLFGDAFNSTPEPDTNNIYRIDPATAIATLVTQTSVTPSNTFVGLDFNPAADAIRYVNEADENLRIDPTTGGVTKDANLNYADRSNPNVVGAAYSNNLPGATTTTLYDIDSTRDILATQDPNAGTLTPVGPLGVDTRRSVGFDIGSNGTAYAALYPEGTTASSFYTINLFTGAATLVGQIGAPSANQPIQGLAVVPFGSVEFSVANYTVNENAGTATVTVNRTGGASGPATVGYSTSDGTATAGSDYTATSGTLTFASGETTKTFSVPILDDSTDESDEAVNLTLSTPTGGAELGTQSTAVLTITDNDGGNGGDDCTITGTAGDDELTGTSGDDVICGLDGNDTIDGGGGNDLLKGGKGSDRIKDDSGNDTLKGGKGKDRLKARDGNGGDTLNGGKSEDRCKEDDGDTVSSC